MTKSDIVNELAKNKIVEKIVYKLANNCNITERTYLEDLINDIYLIILEKEDVLIEGLYDRDEIGFFVLRIVRNQLLSSHSPYYRDYIVPLLKKTELTDYEDYREGTASIA